MNDYFEQHIGRWVTGSPHVDHSVMSKYAVNSIYCDQFRTSDYKPLAEPRSLQHIDFYDAQEAACRTKVKFVATHDGEINGFLGWFDIDFDPARLSTAPNCPATHWGQAFLPLARRCKISAGDEIEFELNRPERGEWSWRFQSGGEKAQHSTFLSRPFSARDLERRSNLYQPVLNDWGLAAKATLDAFGKNQTVQQIARDIRQSWPGIFPDEQTATRFVHQQVDRFGHHDFPAGESGHE